MADWESLCADEANAPLCELYDVSAGLYDGELILVGRRMIFCVRDSFFFRFAVSCDAGHRGSWSSIV